MSVRVLCVAVITGMTVPNVATGPLVQDDVKSRIIGATTTLTGHSESPPTMEAIVAAVIELLDVSVAVTPDNQYKSEIQERIAVAKDRMSNLSLFDDKARQYLSFAYRMMTDGRKYEMPEELDEFVTPAELQEKTLRYVERLVTLSLEALEGGNRQETARILLEIALMTVTPHPGQCWSGSEETELPWPLTAEIDMVLAAGYLRGADLWHMASALYLAADPKAMSYVTLDKPQRAVARKLGFKAITGK